MPQAGKVDQPLVDAKLRSTDPAGTLADAFQPSLGGQREDVVGNQRVVENDIGLRQGVRGMQGQQTWVAGARADQPDGPWFEKRGNQPGRHEGNLGEGSGGITTF
jgi:hypothetical protein